LRCRCWGGPSRGFHRSAGFFLSAARGFFLRAGFFFHAARGFFRSGTYHERLALSVIALALRFHAAVFFQHTLAGGEF
jgi:hypothetical protein